ncbi:discoidin domain-containing protein [Catenuloplanes niger]|uniref:F5/8 type C domain-containing protein n=1 Tax=Catenuloplanes niger TaxID=587534 RepID=A0AAE4CTK4_9ACTN|nr:discoidin domain-containing protein [Catenuloplanes niger]MDR7322363.1 hypothetical protein [Catenuloplanes niger]
MGGAVGGPPGAGGDGIVPGARRRRAVPWLVGLGLVAVVGLAAAVVPLLGREGGAQPVALPSAMATLSWQLGYPSGPSTVAAAAPTPSPSATPSASVPASPSRVVSATAAAPSPSRAPSSKAAAPTGPKANPSGANIARGRPAFASTEADGTRAVSAVDGDMATRWSSAYAAPEWIMVDLGETWRISGVTLFWETAYGRSYRIEVSGDGSTWKSIYSTTAGAGGTVKATAPSGTTGRYVRLYGTEVATIWGFSIFEMEVR